MPKGEKSTPPSINNPGDPGQKDKNLDNNPDNNKDKELLESGVPVSAPDKNQPKPEAAEPSKQEKSAKPLSIEDLLGMPSEEVTEDIKQTKELLAKEAVSDQTQTELLIEYDGLRDRWHELEEIREQKLQVASQNPYSGLRANDYQALEKAGLIDQQAVALIKGLRDNRNLIKAKHATQRSDQDNRTLNDIHEKLKKIQENLTPLIAQREEQTNLKNQQEQQKIKQDFDQETILLRERLTQLLENPMLEDAIKKREERRAVDERLKEEKQLKEVAGQAEDIEKIQAVTIANLQKILGEKTFKELNDTFRQREANPIDKEPTKMEKIFFQQARNQLRDAIMANKIRKPGEIAPYYRFLFKGNKKVNYWGLINSVRSQEIKQLVAKHQDPKTEPLREKVKGVTDMHKFLYALLGNRKKPGDTRSFPADSLWETFSLSKKMMKILDKNDEDRANAILAEYKASRKKEDQSLEAKKKNYLEAQKKELEADQLIQDVLNEGGVKLNLGQKRVPGHGKSRYTGETIWGAIKIEEDLQKKRLVVAKIARPLNNNRFSWLREGHVIDQKRLPREVMDALIAQIGETKVQPESAPLSEKNRGRDSRRLKKYQDKGPKRPHPKRHRGRSSKSRLIEEEDKKISKRAKPKKAGLPKTAGAKKRGVKGRKQ